MIVSQQKQREEKSSLSNRKLIKKALESSNDKRHSAVRLSKQSALVAQPTSLTA